ncbi:hypothetical protein D3C80_1584270 [compost metagenome]
MLCTPEVQAVAIEMLGPRMPYMIVRWPAIMFTMVDGTKNGLIFRGPPLTSELWFSSIKPRPPIPEPIAAPMRLALASVISSCASCMACMPAAIPYWMKASILRASLREMKSSELKFFTRPANLVA